MRKQMDQEVIRFTCFLPAASPMAPTGDRALHEMNPWAEPPRHFLCSHEGKKAARQIWTPVTSNIIIHSESSCIHRLYVFVHFIKCYSVWWENRHGRVLLHTSPQPLTVTNIGKGKIQSEAKWLSDSGLSFPIEKRLLESVTLSQQQTHSLSANAMMLQQLTLTVS